MCRLVSSMRDRNSERGERKNGLERERENFPVQNLRVSNGNELGNL